MKGPAHTPKKAKVPRKRYVRPPREAVPEEEAVAPKTAAKPPKRAGRILGGAAASLILPPDDTPAGLPKWGGAR